MNSKVISTSVFTIITMVFLFSKYYTLKEIFIVAPQQIIEATVESKVQHKTTTTIVHTKNVPLTRTYHSITSWYDYELPDDPDYSKKHNTCASRDFPKGTILLVESLNGYSVECRVNDYGPDIKLHPDRMLDLSSHAFEQLAPLDLGLITVTIQEVK